jgi:hypothetical protein
MQIRWPSIRPSSVYFTIYGNSRNFPVTAAGFQRTWSGKITAGVAKIAPQTFLLISQTVLGFGAVPVGTSSLVKNRFLTNEGTTPITISRIYFSGPNAAEFSQTNNCGSVLEPGVKCRISLTFTPAAAGKRQGALVIGDSDPATPHVIAVTGTGT